MSIRGGRVAGFTFFSIAVWHRAQLPRRVAQSVNACARAHRAKDVERADAVRKVSVRLEKVQREVLRSVRTSGAPAQSLTVEEDCSSASRRGDVQGSSRRGRTRRWRAGALYDLATLLLTIAEHHTNGRILQLLDDKELKHPRTADVAPLRDWDPVREKRRSGWGTPEHGWMPSRECPTGQKRRQGQQRVPCAVTGVMLTMAHRWWRRRGATRSERIRRACASRGTGHPKCVLLFEMGGWAPGRVSLSPVPRAA